MKRLVKYFLTGIASLVPLLLTITIVSWLFEVGDNLLGKYYRSFWGINIPGLGLVSILLIVVLVGYFTTWYIGKAFWKVIDDIANRLPFVKSIYSTIKEAAGALFGQKKSFGQPVALKVPGSNLLVLGFLTNADLSQLGFPDHVAVYVPQSLQWAGMTFIVPKNELQPATGQTVELALTTEETMKFILSAGVATKNEN